MDDVTPEGTPSVADRLLASSTFFARSAATAYASESWEVFHLHLATALDQLIKAVLASVHPSFIADTSANFDSLLHLCGFGARAQTPEFVAAVRTITASVALKRVERVADDYRKPGSRVILPLETRNAIVHVGHQARTEGELTLGEVAHYVGPLLSSLNMEPTEYWGDSFGLVADHANRRLGAAEAAYKRKVQAAKDRYARTITTMNHASLVAFLAAVAATSLSEPFESAPVECPACGHPGWLAGSPEPDWEADYDVADGEGYVSGVYVSAIQLRASGFDCPTCGLSLDTSLLPIAELDQVTVNAEDFDVSEATTFFQRQLAEQESGEY